MITVGEKLNLHFQVKVAQNGNVREVVFGELLTRPTLVSVYMKNNTGSCDRQNEQLVQHAAAFDQAGYNLLAISRDTAGSHTRYAAAKRIPYPLVSDPHDQFAQAAGILVTKSMYGRSFVGPARTAFALAPDGTVLAVLEKVDAAHHGAQLLKLLGCLGRDRSSSSHLGRKPPVTPSKTEAGAPFTR